MILVQSYWNYTETIHTMASWKTKQTHLQWEALSNYVLKKAPYDKETKCCPNLRRNTDRITNENQTER